MASSRARITLAVPATRPGAAPSPRWTSPVTGPPRSGSPSGGRLPSRQPHDLRQPLGRHAVAPEVVAVLEIGTPPFGQQLGSGNAGRQLVEPGEQEVLPWMAAAVPPVRGQGP